MNDKPHTSDKLARIRLSKEQHQLVAKAAQREGYVSVPAYMKVMVLKAAAEE